MSLVAHGIGGVRDLPVPAWLFYWGAAVVLVLSFVALGLIWQQPLLQRHAAGRDLGFRSTVSLDEGLAREWDWIRGQE